MTDTPRWRITSDGTGMGTNVTYGGIPVYALSVSFSVRADAFAHVTIELDGADVDLDAATLDRLTALVIRDGKSINQIRRDAGMPPLANDPNAPLGICGRCNWLGKPGTPAVAIQEGTAYCQSCLTYLQPPRPTSVR